MDQASFSLDAHASKHRYCPYCHQSGTLVSHGYFYKRSSDQPSKPVGKRILCSSRCSRSGCGRTHSWYLADIVPKKRYPLSVFIAFIQALRQGKPVENAYLIAMNNAAKEPRQAWRWLQSLHSCLARWRSILSFNNEQMNVTQRSKTLKILLPTLDALANKIRGLPCVQVLFRCSFC